MLRKSKIARLFLFAAAALVPAQLYASGVQLPVPRVTIHPGDQLSGQNIVERRFPERTTQQFAVVSHRNELIGMVARRTLLPGKPVPINAITEQLLVKRGDAAKLVFREQGLRIVMQVEALQSGGSGATVRVRNIDSGVVVIGTVQSDGSIRAGN
ncbi:flagellar basal body P-ring formation chaperone FlgA [Roseibium polysiphoniae]|uniref:flagellar basal body P-ring formation chaperone FlgA n=1 Tax=Roseibium polysiphoniae TaxID=2571221 RepID=UPI003298F5AD